MSARARARSELRQRNKKEATMGRETKKEKTIHRDRSLMIDDKRTTQREKQQICISIGTIDLYTHTQVRNMRTITRARTTQEQKPRQKESERSEKESKLSI